MSMNRYQSYFIPRHNYYSDISFFEIKNLTACVGLIAGKKKQAVKSLLKMKKVL
jgi:hypothetical protein